MRMGRYYTQLTIKVYTRSGHLVLVHLSAFAITLLVLQYHMHIYYEDVS